jgi:hypothetical protein
MKALYTAIVAKYATAGGATLRGKVGDTIYPFRAPQGRALPLILFQHSGTVVDYTMVSGATAATEIRTVSIDFVLYDDDASPLVIEDAAEDVYALFDDALLTVTGWTVFDAERENDLDIRDEPNKMWQKVITYRYQLGRDR